MRRRVNVMLFARVKELANAPSLEAEIEAEATVSDLKAALARVCPALGVALKSCRVAIDAEYASDDQVIAEGSEFALIPPVSGGSPRSNPTWTHDRDHPTSD